MARRRRFQGGRIARRTTDWTAGAVGSSFASVAAGVTSTTTIATATEEGDTIVRIVGRVLVAPQADVSMMCRLGIYYSRSDTAGGNVTLLPNDSNDVSREEWMWWDAIMTFGSAWVPAVFDRKIDIKVKRRFYDAGDVIRIGIHSDVAYSFGQQLRVLRMNR